MRTLSDTMDAPASATPNIGLVVGIAVVAALGGLLFGYDTGIVYERYDEKRTDSGDATRAGIYRWFRQWREFAIWTSIKLHKH